MKQIIRTLVMGLFLVSTMACSDHGHSHDDGSDHNTSQQHDSIK